MYPVFPLGVLFWVLISRGILVSSVTQTEFSLYLMQADDDRTCNNGIRCPTGTFCSEGVCKECSPCPDGVNHVYLLGDSRTLRFIGKCYQDGMCPNICSRMTLSPEERAGTELCEKLAKACDKTCMNGGTLNSTVCTCSCSEPWTGSTCEDCSLDCGNKGTLLESTCSCSCHGSWTGPKCTDCDISCNNGGTLDTNLCQCECAKDWTGTTCSECGEVSCIKGTLNATSCECVCNEGWTGKLCTQESEQTEGSTLNPQSNQNNEPDDGNTLIWAISACAVLLVVLTAIYFIGKCLGCKKERSSSKEGGIEETLIAVNEDPLCSMEFTLSLGDDSPILNVKNWQELQCQVMETCCCLRMDQSMDKKYIPFTPGDDTIALPTRNYHLIPGMIYNVKVGNMHEDGRRTTFHPLAQGSFMLAESEPTEGSTLNPQSDQNNGTTLDNSNLECRKTIADVLNNSSLCKRLEVELNDPNQKYLSRLVAEAFELTDDQCRRVKDAGNDNHLGILCSILESKHGDDSQPSIHVLMDYLKDEPQARLFIEKLARFTHRSNNCVKCMQVLHSSHC